MRPFKSQVDYPATPAEVGEMLANPEFVEKKVAASRPVHSSAKVEGSADGPFTVTTVRGISTDRLPQAVRTLVGNSVDLEFVESWLAPGPDGSRRGTFSLDVVGKPAKASGTLELAATPGGSQVIYDGAVEAKVPLIGGKLEAQAAGQVDHALRLERTAGLAWLENR